MSEQPTTEAVDLKPCPFCGVAADGPNIDRGYDDGLRRMWIECPHCAANMDRLFGAGISDADGAAVVAQLWNRRPSPEPSADAERYQFLRTALFCDWDWWCRLSRETADEAEFDAKVDAARVALTKATKHQCATCGDGDYPCSCFSETKSARCRIPMSYGEPCKQYPNCECGQPENGSGSDGR